MAYWWVNQKQTYRLEHSEGYLWAPFKDKAGNTNDHWELMDLVEPGDLIFSYVNAKISKLAIAQTKATPADKPEGKSFNPWQKHGRRIEAAYSDLPTPLTNAVLQNKMGSELMGSGLNRPLTSKGGGRQAYFFSLLPEIGRKLLELSGLEGNTPVQELGLVIEQAATDHTPAETTSKAVRESRKGQGKFRDDVLTAWNDQCSVTGSKIKQAIRASHIKPWSDSDNRERLDPHNGLALVATLDSLFDNGLITFDDDGKIIIHVARDQWGPLGLREDLCLRHKPTDQMREYLSHHRAHVVDH